LVYDARVRFRFATLPIVAGALFATGAWAQEDASLQKSSPADHAKSQPKYDQTFSGSIVEVTASQITVSRSILGKPAEKHTFSIKSDTRIEGKLKVRVKVTVGYVTTDDDDDVARLVVVRTSQKPAEKK
jgi:ribosomal protein S1